MEGYGNYTYPPVPPGTQFVPLPVPGMAMSSVMPPIPVEPPDPDDAIEYEAEGNILPLHGNTTTMNLDELLFQNIRRSDYFNDLFTLKTFHEVVDEIYNEVSNLDPWVATVAHRKPSTAFTLLYKLFTLKVTRRQMKQLIIHKDSPYIRALGFLYLRYTCPPKELWNWFGSYLEDDEGVLISATTTSETPMCVFIVDLLLQNKHCGTILPRIPVTALKRIREELKSFVEENKDSAVSQSTALRDALANESKNRKGSRARDELSGRKRHRVDDSLLTSKERNEMYRDRGNQHMDRRRRRRSRSRSRERRRRRSRSRSRSPVREYKSTKMKDLLATYGNDTHTTHSLGEYGSVTHTEKIVMRQPAAVKKYKSLMKRDSHY